METQEIALPAKVGRTKIETLLEKKGSLIVKVFHDIGTAPAAYGNLLEFRALRFFEPGKEEYCTEGIQVQITQEGSEQNAITFLDMDEVDSVIHALEYMRGLIARCCQKPPDDYTEVTFVTKGQFEVGFYVGSKLQAFLKTAYSSAFVAPGSLEIVAALLREGKSYLQMTTPAPSV